MPRTWVLNYRITTDKFTAGQIDKLKKMAGSYEALFIRKAIKYRELKLKDRDLQEKITGN